MSAPYKTSLFIGNLEGQSQRGGGWQGKREAGVVNVELIYIYKYLNIFIDYIFKDNQETNSASARNRTDISVIFK